MSTAAGRLVWVDCEMTGLDLKSDLILEIAVIITEGDSLQEAGSLLLFFNMIDLLDF